MTSQSRFSGIVERGDGAGTRLGYPTANIACDARLNGIFVGCVEIDDVWYPAALFSSAHRSVLEAHILDHKSDLYGKAITIAIIKKLRDDKRFESQSELIRAIEDDVQNVREYFRVHPCSPAS